jgi:hypothetical protein
MDGKEKEMKQPLTPKGEQEILAYIITIRNNTKCNKLQFPFRG